MAIQFTPNHQRHRKDTMDKIQQGLMIANEVFKIPVAWEQFQNTRGDRQREERLDRGEITEFEAAKSGLLPAAPGEESYNFNVLLPDGQKQMKPFKKQGDLSDLEKRVNIVKGLSELERNTGGKALSEETIRGSGTDLKTAAGAVEDLKNTLNPPEKGGYRDVYGDSGTVTSLVSKLPLLGNLAPRSKGLEAVRAGAKQVIGKYLEGGVLRKEDEAKYDRILPSAGDTPDIATEKLKNLEKMIQERAKGQNELLKGSGFKTINVPKGAPMPKGSANEGSGVNLSEIQKELQKRGVLK